MSTLYDQGISLTIEQFNTLLSVLPQIEQHLADAGISLERPAFGGSAAVEHEDEGGAKEDQGEEEEEKVEEKEEEEKVEEKVEEKEEEEEEEEEEKPKPKANSKRGRK